MSTEEDILFATAESDAMLSARADRSLKRLEDLLRDRTRKACRVRKMGYTDLEPWLMPDRLADLNRRIRDLNHGHHRRSRADRAVMNHAGALKPVAMRFLKPGCIVDAWIPFTDSNEYKRRPAVVISASKHDVTVFPVTSSLGHRRLKTPIHVLHEWQDAGLTRPSGMQLKEVVIPRSDIIGASGELCGSDRSRFFHWVHGGSGELEAVVKNIHQAGCVAS